MKKVININFQGRVVPIEETSFELLKQYTDSLRIYFANEDGRDEIINDIESRIGELFQERITKGATCITDDDVNAIINNMGRPQDFAAADGDQPNEDAAEKNPYVGSAYSQTHFTNKRLYRDANNRIIGGVCSGIAAYFNIEPIIVRLVFIFSGIGFLAYFLLWAFVPSSHNVQNGVRKRLYRNPDEKWIAGVCSGIASYFNINVWIPRILFFIPFFSLVFRWGDFGPLTFPQFLNFTFSPGTILIYIILWLVIPEAKSTSEKLEMKGEKVDLNSIKNSVMGEMKEVQQRMEKLGKEAKDFAQERGKTLGPEISYAARRTGRSLGDVIVFLVKAFGYFIIGCVALALIVALFSLAVAAIGVFPLKAFLLNDGWQSAYAWGSLLFFIGIPVVGVITFIIRRIAKIKSNNNLMRYSFLALWLLGIFCFISLIVSVGRDFKSVNTINEENIALSNPGVNKMEISSFASNRYYGRNNFLHLEPFANFDEDTAFVNNVKIRIVKSATDSFNVTLVKICNGRNRRFADTLANKIVYNISQVDSMLLLDKGIAITKEDKFRNQQVIVTIAVPVGKIINVNRKLGWRNWEHFNGPWRSAEWDWDASWDEDEVNGWENHYGEDLVMRSDGLYTLDGKPADRNINDEYRREDHNDWDEENNRTSPNDSIEGYRYEQTQKSIDSLNLIKEKQMQKVKDSLKEVKEQIDRTLEKLENKDAVNTEAFLPLNDQRYDFVVDI
jgi:phage shock protein PspC (stress-responsive transcriptional regulator)